MDLLSFCNFTDIDTPKVSETIVTRKKGDSVEVECDAKGNPTPNVEWNKNGECTLLQTTQHLF